MRVSHHELSLPNNLPIQLPLASAPLYMSSLLLLQPIVWVHHWFLIFIQLHLHVGVQQGSQGTQETP